MVNSSTCRHHRAVELLLRSGADFFVVDRTTRRSAIHYAANAGATRVLKTLLSDETCIHTEEGMQPLKYVRVQDMSGQCRLVPGLDALTEYGKRKVQFTEHHNETGGMQNLILYEDLCSVP